MQERQMINVMLAPGQMPGGMKEVKAYAQAARTKAQVGKKLDELKAMDNSPVDVAPDLNKIVVDQQKFSGTGKFLGIALADKLTGVSEFDTQGNAKMMSLSSEKEDKAYRYEVLSDGSKAYAAPILGDGHGVHQIVIERPDGTLFIETSSGDQMDANMNFAQKTSSMIPKARVKKA